ncbi:MAG: BlaI/MecI/CopY family transcriptional regulator [Candidatus Latescibacterota bacterium]|jgi:BlaI family penicillinase repressor
MSTQPKPTDSELNILKILWEKGPLTVREVHEALNNTRQTGYTTTLKLMQIMIEKKLVKRDKSQRAHIYEAQIQQQDTQQHLVKNLLDQVFSGSTTSLVMQALSTKKASAEEIEQIRKMLDDYEGGTP